MGTSSVFLEKAEWILQMWSIYSTQYSAALKLQGTHFLRMQMNEQDMVLTEVSLAWGHPQILIYINACNILFLDFQILSGNHKGEAILSTS